MIVARCGVLSRLIIIIHPHADIDPDSLTPLCGLWWFALRIAAVYPRIWRIALELDGKTTRKQEAGLGSLWDMSHRAELGVILGIATRRLQGRYSRDENYLETRR